MMDSKSMGMPRLSVLILYFFTLFLPYGIYGQSMALRQYSQEHTGATVYQMLQDRRGFLWFATESGIVQFDGVQSRHFGADEGISNGFVITMAQGGGDTLWLGTWGGGLLYYTNDTVMPYPYQRLQLPRRIKQIMIDKHKRLWVSNTYKVGFLSNHLFTVLDFGYTSGKKRQVHALYEDKAGRIFFGTNSGLFCFAEGKVNRVQLSPPVNTQPIYSITGDTSGALWLGSAGSIYRVDSLLHVFVYHNILSGSEQIATLYKDRKNRLWGVGFQSGVFIIDDTSVVHLSKFLPLDNTHINTLYEDHEGNMWLGTYGAGGVMLPNFCCINYTTADGLANNYVLSMCKGKQGTLFVGTRDGVTIISRDSMSVLHLPLSKQHQGMHYTPALLSDASGIIWMGVNNAIVQYRNNAVLAIDTGAAANLLYQDQTGIIWMCKPRGIRLYDGVAYRSWHGIPPLMSPSRTAARIMAMCEDSDSVLWFATDNGIYSYNRKTYQHYTTADGLPSNVVHDILSKRNTLWMATTKGLCSRIGNQLRQYTQKDGLRSNNCLVLLADSSGVLWVGTDRGLHRFDGSNFTVYGVHDGLVSNRIHTLQHGADGVLWVGTDRGVSKFQIRNSGSSAVAPPVCITGLIASTTVFANPTVIELPYDDNNIRIDFTAIAYQYPDDVRYRYKVEGIDKHWQYSTARSIHYSALASGVYTFVVQARVKNGDWSKPARLLLTIRTPLWATWWFRGVLLIAVVGSIWVVLYWRISMGRKKQVEHLKTRYRVLQLEQKALHALMNPHFVFNALTSIHRYIHVHRDEQAAGYLARFAKLIRMTFENAQSTYVPLSEELQRLELYLSLEKMRFEDRLSYTITIDTEVEDDDIFVPSMILQPYVENAIVHGLLPMDGGGHISIVIKQQGSAYLLLVVEDNGVGIEIAQAQSAHHSNGHRSSGMALTEERLKLLSQIANTAITLRVIQLPSTEEGRAGTRVEIVLPMDIAVAAGEHETR